MNKGEFNYYFIEYGLKGKEIRDLEIIEEFVDTFKEIYGDVTEGYGYREEYEWIINHWWRFLDL